MSTCVNAIRCRFSFCHDKSIASVQAPSSKHGNRRCSLCFRSKIIRRKYHKEKLKRCVIFGPEVWLLRWLSQTKAFKNKNVHRDGFDVEVHIVVEIVKPVFLSTTVAIYFKFQLKASYEYCGYAPAQKKFYRCCELVTLTQFACRFGKWTQEKLPTKSRNKIKFNFVYQIPKNFKFNDQAAKAAENLLLE